jgi:hypothetical protein
MAEKLDTIQKDMKKRPPSDKLLQAFEYTAGWHGMDPQDPLVKKRIEDSVEDLRYTTGKPDDVIAANLVKNPSQLVGYLVEPADKRVKSTEFQDIAKQREGLAKEVGRQAEMRAVVAPFATSVRETTNKGGGAYQKAYVDEAYRPLQSFDAQVADMRAARTSDLEAVGKDYMNRKAKAEAEGADAESKQKKISLFNTQLNNDANSLVSQVARDGAEAGLDSLKIKKPDGFDGFSAVQVDAFMKSTIADRLANAKSDAERKEIIARASQAQAATNETLARARQQEFIADKMDASGNETASAAPADVKEYQIGKPEAIPALAQVTPKSTQDRIDAHVKKQQTFQAEAAQRQQLARLIDKAQKEVLAAPTGYTAGKREPLTPSLQQLEKTLSTISMLSGGASGTDMAKSLAQASQPGITKNKKVILDKLAELATNLDQTEQIGSIRMRSDRDIDETRVLNDLYQFKLVKPDGSFTVLSIPRNGKSNKDMAALIATEKLKFQKSTPGGEFVPMSRNN